MLETRGAIIRGIRRFFTDRGYLETDTPLLAPNLIPETCLEVFETAWLPPPGSSAAPRQYWLIPSPEIWMKRLIAAHRRNIFQVCKCFRNGESSGHLHSPEFTMLEYYTMDAGYLDSLALTEALFAFLLAENAPRNPPAPPFLRLTMEEAFLRYGGFSLEEAASAGTLAAEARRLGLSPRPDAGPGEIYDLIFIHQIEPALPREKPVALLDYPAFVPCLAKQRGSVVERWELYFDGIELANCYTEETSPDAVRAYFDRESALKRRSAVVPHAVDGDYWKVFLPAKTGPYPPCSGVALGVDRLVMALTGKRSIDSVLP
jgi:lysyl-tRNA synthetase class 2